MHALALADEIGIPRVLVPRHPGNFSALGLLASDIKHDEVRTRVGPLRERWGQVADLFVEMESSLRRQLELEGFDGPRQRLRRSLDLRYRGQAFELNLETSDEPLAVIEAAFHERHRAVYGHADPTATVELVNARLSAYGVVDRPATERPAAAAPADGGVLIERRRIRFDGAAHDCPVWERERWPEGAELAGPAIVEEFGATTVVPPGWRGRLDAHGNLRFERS